MGYSSKAPSGIRQVRPRQASSRTGRPTQLRWMMVDGSIFTIFFNKVRRKAAQFSAKKLLDANVPNFGAVLNGLNLAVSGYYYAQYYDKSYKDYYVVMSKNARGHARIAVQAVAGSAAQDDPILSAAGGRPRTGDVESRAMTAAKEGMSSYRERCIGRRRDGEGGGGLGHL